MSSKICVLFGQIISSWKNNDGDRVILVEDQSGITVKRKWNSLPKKYEIILPREGAWGYNFAEYNKPSFKGLRDDLTWENKNLTQIVVFTICVRFFSNGKTSGFNIEKLISIDLECDLTHFLNNIFETRRAASTDLPLLYKYLNNIGSTRFKFNDVEYEMVFIEDKKHLALGHVGILTDKLKKPRFPSSWGEPGKTLVNVYKDNKNYLSIHNISLIFDKFYRPVRGLGFNYEYTYGEAVTYEISENGDIDHCFSIDKVKDTPDTSSDRSSLTKTTVLRLGDRLSNEMIGFLKEPVKGHYKPIVLFKD